MSDTEYEYESHSDWDEEPVGWESFWNEMCKRIRCSSGHINIEMEENDDTSVLREILNVVSEGVSGQFLAIKLEMEHIHNAIVNNPSKNKGMRRLKDMKRLKYLLNPELYIKDIFKLDIPNAEDYTSLPRLQNLRELVLHKPRNDLLRTLAHFEALETLELSNITSVPPLYHIKNLKVVHLKNIKRFRHATTITLMSNDVQIYISDSFLWPADAIIMRSRKNVIISNVMINDGVQCQTFEEWSNKNKREFKIMPFKLTF